MSPMSAHPDDAGALVAPDTPARVPSDLHDQHETALLCLAHTICQNDEMASRAVAQAFDAAFADTPRSGENPRLRHLLARLTYLACTLMYPAPTAPTARDLTAPHTVTDPHRRALLALTTYGDHTCDEAATLLHLNPDSAARALRTTMPALAVPTQTSPAHDDESVYPLTLITVRPGTGHDVVALTGELDLCTAPQLTPVIHDLLAQGRTHITINLDRVTFIDASGLSALGTAHRDITRSHGTLVITHNPLCARLLALTGVAPLFTVRSAPPTG